MVKWAANFPWCVGLPKHLNLIKLQVHFLQLWSELDIQSCFYPRVVNAYPAADLKYFQQSPLASAEQRLHMLCPLVLRKGRQLFVSLAHCLTAKWTLFHMSWPFSSASWIVGFSGPASACWMTLLQLACYYHAHLKCLSV